MLDATVAVDTHPVVSQLSALHRFRIHLDIAVVVVVLVLTNLIAPLRSRPPPLAWRF
jgi:hypothetical protein